MKKILKKYPAMSTRDDFPRHIHFLRIHAFANESIDFTKEENAHFDDCRLCRIKVMYVLRNLAPRSVPATMTKAA
jgi:hypothetical protein